MVKLLSPAQVRQLSSDGTAVIIDVREPGEYENEHIVGAVNMPLESVALDKVEAIAGNKQVIFSCHSGRRSQRACEIVALASGDQEIISLDGGIAAWKKAGLPTIKHHYGVISIERQMHLLSAMLVLVSLLLGLYVNPAFFWIQVVMVIGWCVSASTGMCVTHTILTRMPWNKP